MSHDIQAVPVLRMSETVRFCFAFCRASSRFGIRMAAMMPMIATTISSSMRVKPLCRLRIRLSINFSFRGMGSPAPQRHFRVSDRSKSNRSRAVTLPVTKAVHGKAAKPVPGLRHDRPGARSTINQEHDKICP